MGAINKP